MSKLLQQIESQIGDAVRLVQIMRNGELAEAVELTEFGKMVIQPTIDNYPPGESEPEWPCFVLARGNSGLGGGGFKTAPCKGEVEIAYFTAPEFEGQGLASQTARLLVQHAWQRDPSLVITAETLQEENASVRILRGIGFEMTDADRLDPDEGVPVWHWQLAPR